MITKSLAGLCCVVAVGLLVFTGMADKEPNLEGVKCIVKTSKAANASRSAEYKEGKVFFCCPGCAKGFAKNSDKFATAANKQLVQTGQYEQKNCPISGRAVNKEQSSTVGGVDVAYCCGGCKSKVNKAKDKEALVFADAAFAKGFGPAKKEKE